MESVIRTLDELVKSKIIEDFAIGGATALIYFSTPTLTEDIDVFVYMKEHSSLVDLRSIYNFLVEHKGATVEGEYVFINGFPVQFLVPYDELSGEAFKRAVAVEYGGLPVKIFALEYLMAIMIQLNKPKYRERLRLLIDEKGFDNRKLTAILEAHGLLTRWEILRKELEQGE